MDITIIGRNVVFGVKRQRNQLARKRIAYIIRNGRLFKDEENIKRQTLTIVDYNLAFIDDGFTVPYKTPFDRGYMQANYGYQKGLAGYPWRKAPFGYTE